MTAVPDSVQTTSEPHLVRAIGVGSFGASVFNLTVASGIFGLPALVAAGLGAAAPLAYVVCACAMALVALCFAEAGSRVPASGGLYAYVEVAFGPFVGFVLGVLFLASTVAGSAAVAALFALTFGEVVPALDTPLARAGIIAIAYGALALLNARGVKLGARTGAAFTLIKLVPLLLLVVVSIPLVHRAYLAWPPVRVGAIGPTCLVLIFAFMGVETALSASGEITDPPRTVPRGIGLGIGGVVVLYLAVQTSAQGVLGPALVQNTAAPLAAVANAAIGGSGRLFILTATALSTLGYLSGDVLAGPRIVYAMALDGTLPGSLARVHPRAHTPYLAIWAYAATAAMIAASGSFERLVILTSVSTLAVYLACCLAVIVLRRRRVAQAGAPFVLPGGSLIPGLASVVVLWLLSSASVQEFAVVGGIVVLAAAAFAVMRYHRRRVALRPV